MLEEFSCNSETTGKEPSCVIKCIKDTHEATDFVNLWSFRRVKYFLITADLGDIGASLIAQLVKNQPAMQETPVRFLGQEDSLGQGQATHSSILGLPLWLSW